MLDHVIDCFLNNAIHVDFRILVEDIVSLLHATGEENPTVCRNASHSSADGLCQPELVQLIRTKSLCDLSNFIQRLRSRARDIVEPLSETVFFGTALQYQETLVSYRQQNLSKAVVEV